jgi:uncharacterized protein (TIGR02594 family)
MKPQWLKVAESEIGIHETPGPKATARITEYHATTSLKATSDEVPWCASFVNWCIGRAGLKGTNSAAAKSWCSWGVPCDVREGAVVVIKQRRTGKDKATGSASGYHVGFLIERTPDHVRILGGNQGDSVKYSNFPLASYAVVEMRWPSEPVAELPEAA